MALALVATVGSASANTYATLAEFETFLEGVYPAPASTVTAATDDNKNRALYTAQADMHRRYGQRWHGDRVDDVQALDWPRASVVNPDVPDLGELFEEDEIPDRVKRSQMLIALAMLDGTYTANAADVAGNVTSFTADGVSIGYGASAAVGSRSQSQIPQEAQSLLALLVQGARIVKA